MTNFKRIKEISFEEMVILIGRLQSEGNFICDDGVVGDWSAIENWLKKPYDPEEW